MTPKGREFETDSTERERQGPLKYPDVNESATKFSSCQAPDFFGVENPRKINEVKFSNPMMTPLKCKKKIKNSRKSGLRRVVL
jgi:hypothetical protein